jgi:predicted NUDIX family NTP pyrophosphohydrolase
LAERVLQILGGAGVAVLDGVGEAGGSRLLLAPPGAGEWAPRAVEYWALSVPMSGVDVGVDVTVAARVVVKAETANRLSSSVTTRLAAPTLAV